MYRERRGFVLEDSKHEHIRNGVYVHTDDTVGGAPVFRRQVMDASLGNEALFWSEEQSMWAFTWCYKLLDETAIRNANGGCIVMRCKFDKPSYGGPPAPVAPSGKQASWQVSKHTGVEFSGVKTHRSVVWRAEHITVRARQLGELTAAERALEEGAYAAACQRDKVSRNTGKALRLFFLCLPTAVTLFAWIPAGAVRRFGSRNGARGPWLGRRCV